MFAFKATKEDMTCLGFKYELGKLYEFNDELKLCEKGFHFCKNLKDINSYYAFHVKNNRYFLIEIPDDAEVIDSKIGNKSVTNKIRFIRELTEQDWIDHGMIREVTDKLFHIKNSFGYERLYEYNDQGEMTHYRDSDGYEEWSEYNDQGNEIYYKNSKGHEVWWEYDEKGNVIHYKHSTGYRSTF